LTSMASTSASEFRAAVAALNNERKSLKAEEKGLRALLAMAKEQLNRLDTERMDLSHRIKAAQMEVAVASEAQRERPMPKAGPTTSFEESEEGAVKARTPEEEATELNAEELDLAVTSNMLDQMMSGQRPASTAEEEEEEEDDDEEK